MQGTFRMGIMVRPRRFTHRIAALAGILPALLAVAAAAPATASTSTADPRWLPWIGCWIPTTATSDVAPALSQSQRVCVVPTDGSSGVDVVNVADGAIVSRVHVDATGERRPVTREGCSGWESAQWSAAAGRVYLKSEVTCAGGIERSSSGILAIASPSDWVDVEVVMVRGQRSTRVVRYRSAPDSTVVDREITTALGGQEMARRAARLAGAALPTIADVIEASRAVDQSTVEAWLLQRMPRFTVEARELRQLANARVPSSVIDLVIALSRPEMFHDRLATRGYTLVRVDVPRAVVVDAAPQQQYDQTIATPVIPSGGYDDRGYQRDRCDRCSDSQIIYYEPYPVYPSYPPYGYGYYPYWPYGPYPVYPSHPKPEPPPKRPPVIVNGPAYPKPPVNQPPPPPVGDTVKGRAVNGRGYTRSSPTTGEPTTGAASPEVVTPPRGAQPRGSTGTTPTTNEPPRTAQPRPVPSAPTDVRPFQPVTQSPPPSAPVESSPRYTPPPERAVPRYSPPPAETAPRNSPPPAESAPRYTPPTQPAPPPPSAPPRTAEPRPTQPPPEVKPPEVKQVETKPAEPKTEPPARTAKPRPPAAG
jgi:hypothetical protein